MLFAICHLHSFRNTITKYKGSDPDQNQCSVDSDLGPNYHPFSRITESSIKVDTIKFGWSIILQCPDKSVTY